MAHWTDTSGTGRNLARRDETVWPQVASAIVQDSEIVATRCVRGAVRGGVLFHKAANRGVTPEGCRGVHGWGGGGRARRACGALCCTAHGIRHQSPAAVVPGVLGGRQGVHAGGGGWAIRVCGPSSGGGCGADVTITGFTRPDAPGVLLDNDTTINTRRVTIKDMRLTAGSIQDRRAGSALTVLNGAGAELVVRPRLSSLPCTVTRSPAASCWSHQQRKWTAAAGGSVALLVCSVVCSLYVSSLQLRRAVGAGAWYCGRCRMSGDPWNGLRIVMACM